MLTEREKEIVRLLQEGLPLTSRPFLVLARRLGMSEEEFIEVLRGFLARGIIRRFGAAVRHQDLGYVANAMVVWEVPPERLEEVGRVMASFEEVTHCYQRSPCPPGWPYNLFTVVHGQTREDCYRVAEKLSRATGITSYRLLFSTAELKKSSMKYFL